MRARSLAVALASAGLLIHAPAPRAQTTQRSMYVSALDQSGAPVAALSPADLVIREDNQPREILRVAPADEPMQIAVLVDNSEAARDYIADIRKALEVFATDMTNGTKHQLSIIALAERPTILSDASADPAAIKKGVFRIFEQPQSGNYLLEGIIEVCRGFTRRETRRPVIVALTTEGPEYSSRRWEDVVRPMQAVGAALHVIVLGPPASGIDEDSRNRSALLDEGPRATGGRRESLLASTALPRALGQLASELRHQYVVTYARPDRLIPPEKVTVAAARAGLTVRGTLIPEDKSQSVR